MVGLIREFPVGSFFIIISAIWAIERTATAFINRNKPECDCERDCECDCDEEDEVIAEGSDTVDE